MKKAVMAVAVVAAFALASCGGGSPADYADDYCECVTEMIETENYTKGKECDEILIEARNEFGGGNRDAAKEFKEALKGCDVVNGMGGHFGLDWLDQE